MRSAYESMDTSVLQKLYEEHSKELEQAVLSGNAWQLVSLKRKRLTELSKILHEKLQTRSNRGPAESISFNTDGRRGPRF